MNLSEAPGPTAPNMEKSVKLTHEPQRQSFGPVAQTQAVLPARVMGSRPA